MKWMLAPDFELTIREIAQLRTSLDSGALNRLAGLPSEKSIDVAPPGATDSMGYDSDSNPDLVETLSDYLRKSTRSPQ
jgi:hypothetical protein